MPLFKKVLTVGDVAETLAKNNQRIGEGLAQAVADNPTLPFREYRRSPYAPKTTQFLAKTQDTALGLGAAGLTGVAGYAGYQTLKPGGAAEQFFADKAVQGAMNKLAVEEKRQAADQMRRMAGSAARAMGYGSSPVRPSSVSPEQLNEAFSQNVEAFLRAHSGSGADVPANQLLSSKMTDEQLASLADTLSGIYTNSAGSVPNFGRSLEENLINKAAQDYEDGVAFDTILNYNF